MDLSEEARLKEYDLLRQEILQFDRLVVQVLGLCFPLLGVVIAQGLASDEARIFLVPLPILFITSLYVADKRWGTWLIAYYLRTRLEGETGPLWETWLYVYRSQTGRSGHEEKRPSIFCPAQNVIVVECLLFNLFGAVSLALLVIRGIDQGISPVWYVLGGVMLAILVAVTTAKTAALIREGRPGSSLHGNAPSDTQIRQALEGWEGLRGGTDPQD
jgi:hypothetical protein